MSRVLWDWSFGDSLAQFRSAVDRLFDPGGGELSWRSRWEAAAFPLLALSEESDRFSLEAELPGVSMNDLEITCLDRQLTVRGERKNSGEPEEAYERRERPMGSFVRAIELPSDVEAGKITASLRDGILEVQIPKSEKSKPRRIEVTIPSHPAERPTAENLHQEE